MSLNEFLANFKGGARPNKFRVQITWPGAVGTPNVRDEIIVSAASMPASVMGVVQVPYLGRQIPVPGDRTFEEWTLTAVNDISHSHRNAFERWSNLINSHEGNVQGADEFRDYATTINVTQLGLDLAPLKTVKLYNAWPSNIAQIDLGYDQNDTLEQYQVTFSYSHWESVSTS